MPDAEVVVELLCELEELGEAKSDEKDDAAVADTYRCDDDPCDRVLLLDDDDVE